MDTYTNNYGDLMCATHHVRMMIPRPRRTMTGRLDLEATPEPWCPSCRAEAAGDETELPDSA